MNYDTNKLFFIVDYWECITAVEYLPQDWTDTEPWMYGIDYIAEYNNNSIVLETNTTSNICRLSWIFYGQQNYIIGDYLSVCNKIVSLMCFL